MRIALFSLLLFRDAVEQELLLRDAAQEDGCEKGARSAAAFSVLRLASMAKVIPLSRVSQLMSFEAISSPLRFTAGR